MRGVREKVDVMTAKSKIQNPKKPRKCYAAWRWRKRPQAKECKQPLESGKGMKTDSSLECPEGTQPWWHHDFSSVKYISDFSPAELKIIHLCCLNH